MNAGGPLGNSIRELIEEMIQLSWEVMLVQVASLKIKVESVWGESPGLKFWLKYMSIFTHLSIGICKKNAQMTV